jgi:hypothetical protein
LHICSANGNVLGVFAHQQASEERKPEPIAPKLSVTAGLPEAAEKKTSLTLQINQTVLTSPTRANRIALSNSTLFWRVAMRHVPAHYDGEKVVLDEPVSLSANTPVEVVIPDSQEELMALKTDVSLASISSLKRIWNNPRDAEYDKL